MKVISVNNIVVPRKNIRKFFIMKTIFNRMLFYSIYNKQIKREEELLKEQDYYYNDRYNYLI